MPLYFLSDNDINILQGVIDAVKSGRINTPSRPPHEHSFSDREDHQSPETYIAFPQDENGIPALTPATGTAPDDYDEPGVATCDIYKIVIKGSTPLLQPIGIDKEVYNLSGNVIPQDWLAVTRDKFGQWLPMIPGGVRMIHGSILGAGSGTNGGFVANDATFSIDNVVAIYGPNPTADIVVGSDPTVDDLLIHNVHHFWADQGDRATCVWCIEDLRWECIQVDC